MIRNFIFRTCIFLFVCALGAQNTKKFVDDVVDEATNNSQLEELGYYLLDFIGPRLVGTPEMKQSHDWVVNTYDSWGIESRLEQWGEWRGWQRGNTQIELLSPRTKMISGTQLAWSPSTSDEGVTAELMVLPKFENKADFESWLPSVKGKMVMISMKELTGRPDYNWEEWATEATVDSMKERRNMQLSAWRENLRKTGLNHNTIIPVLEEAGAVAIIQSQWSKAFGANKIFGARTQKIPTVDILLEDYTMLYRMVEHGDKPTLNITAISKELGAVPTHNSFGEIKGVEKPDEYVMLSAHLDSWDGANGATDNGTGTLVMMEAMRLLKQFYPKPKRTILAAHWGCEELGLNGSRAFVEDHPEIVENLHALFNQDNGTGRVVNITGSGFLHAYEYFSKWLQPVPESIREPIKTVFPGIPGRGGSDYASFVVVGAPGFSLTSASWSYGNYTWHTNLDTYDKVVWDEVRDNAILVAILVYMACEDPELFPRDKRVMPINKRTGLQMTWPNQYLANRRGGLKD
ncbi:MAG: M20/M25/M40 family metallo-hydrolase [bacterium]